MLARYEVSAREFLYPTPTLTGKDGVERELLLSRTVHFTVSQFKSKHSTSTHIPTPTLWDANCHRVSLCILSGFCSIKPTLFPG